MNYYEHHLGDYLRDCAHLSMLEEGAYRRLLDAYYVREAPLPLDDRECQKLARASTAAERKAVAYVLEHFFKIRDGARHQQRADEEIARFKAKAASARASAKAKWAKGQGGSGDANALRTHSERIANASDPQMRTGCETHALQSPVSNPQSPVSSNHSLSRESVRVVAIAPEPERLLERLRETYPRGIYPQSDWLLAEREARMRLDEGHTVEELLSGCGRYAKQCEARGNLGTQFVESPRKFFTVPECKFREPFPLPANGKRKSDWVPPKSIEELEAMEREREQQRSA